MDGPDREAEGHIASQPLGEPTDEEYSGDVARLLAEVDVEMSSDL